MYRRIFLFYLLLSVPCQAEIITVDDDGPADFNNIQTAIDYSTDGDIIIVQPGHYDGRLGFWHPYPSQHIFIDFLGKNITLTSINPSNLDIVYSTVIDATVRFSGTEDSNCVLSGFKITGKGQDGIVGMYSLLGTESTRATIENCIIQKIMDFHCISYCDGLIKNCLLSDSYNGAGAATVFSPTVFECHGKLLNCTIANNWCSFEIFIGWNSGHLELENCIVYGNMSRRIYVPKGCSIDISYCNIQGGLKSISIGSVETGDILWGPGNIDKDPCFIQDGSWYTVEGDYHLKSQSGRWDTNTHSWILDDFTSPCIDAGNPGCSFSSEPNDSNNIRINMGAFGGTPLASNTPYGWYLLADLTNDGIVDFNDLSFQVADWLQTGECLPGDLDRNKTINFSDIALFAADWLKETSWHQP